ncbi:zinc-binding dehydrogenase [Saccharomonospora sp. NPDC046836]|uniref:zinc-binding dehydrogenase n=1 Tax=Saccharomonospora sp. NPDC046836 TaxID=3156921 RepID=UPI00340C36BF
MATPATVAVLPHGKRLLELRNVTLEPGPFEVVVRQTAAGVCHSQLDQIDNPTRFGAPAKSQPVVMGHESVGTIVDIGTEVHEFAIGDEVLVTWVPRTRRLDRLPQPSTVALDNGECAVTHNVFAWGTHTVVDELFVCPAPEGTPRDVGAIVGCAVMTGAGAVLNTAAVEPGHSVVVWGAGGVGLSAVAAARIAGAAPVIAVDVADEKLDQARLFGAHDTVNVVREDPVEKIHQLTRTATGSGADYVLDCIAKPDTVRDSLAAVRAAHLAKRPGGTVILVGVPTEPLQFDGLDLVAKEKRLIGCRAGDSVPEEDFSRLVRWHRSGQLDLSKLVSRRYRLEQINEAVDDLRRGRVVGRAILEL